KYFNERIALVADSAHNMHPLAGQGLNMGIKDVDTLCSLIYENNLIGLEIDKFMLKRYEAKRKYDNINMIRITDSLNKIFTIDSSICNFITRKGLKLINNLPFCKELCISYAKGFRIN
ncbi:MAG: FAD-dependent monooxygenase, partial [Rickettsiaceae bacterium]|nr:FAD-dependent monooxygenase [Rickettsiaceae bacterium]